MTLSRWALASRRVLHGQELQDAAIVVDGERIEAVLGRDQLPEDLAVIDMGERVVMPGLVDSLVRLGEPGRAEWDGIGHSTRAAAAGGVTTLAELPLPSQPVTGTIEALEAKRWAARDHLHVDVGLQAVLLPGYQDQIEPLIDAGVLAFRAYLTDSGVSECRPLGATDLEMAMPVLERRGLTLFVHPELSPPKRPTPAGRRRPSRPKATGESDARSYGAYCSTRPSHWEIDAIRLMTRLCRLTGTRVQMAPLASAHAIEPLRSALDEGLPFGAGTAPHYLRFAADEIPDGDPRFKCRPPIRGDEHREGLWRALAEGVLDVIGSDHASAPTARRHLETGNLRRAWPGISSLQLLLPALWTLSLSQGVPLAELARWLGSRPAELLGLGGRKGRLAEGHDADFVVWDPEETFEVVGAELEHRYAQTPWAGLRLFGTVQRTYVRGQQVYDRDEGFGERSGQLLER